MNDATDGLDQWEACPPGELERFVRGLRARRRRRAILQLAGSTGALLLLSLGVAVALRSLPCETPSTPGNITCREVEKHLGDYVAGELDPALAKRIRIHLDHCPGCKALYENALLSQAPTARAAAVYEGEAVRTMRAAALGERIAAGPDASGLT